jgi:hypothetical protein
MAVASLRALLSNAIDYAGLFPPANLALEPALRNQAGYVLEPEAWMLGCFILPVGEFDAAGRWIDQFEGQHPLRISVLGSRTETAEGFRDSLSGIEQAVNSFRSTFKPAVLIEQLEIPLPSTFDASVIETAAATSDAMKLKTFLEAPAKSADEAIGLIAQNNHAQSGNKLGFKLRTGGVTAEAFPSSETIAGVLHAAGRQKTPIKFTAGLHHPVRLFHDSVQTRMHGFLNVLGAGVLALEHGWPEATIVEMLEDEEPGSFSFTDESFGWRQWKIAVSAIKSRRQLVTSFGSCSFDEPRDDLRALRLLT